MLLFIIGFRLFNITYISIYIILFGSISWVYLLLNRFISLPLSSLCSLSIALIPFLQFLAGIRSLEVVYFYGIFFFYSIYFKYLPFRSPSCFSLSFSSLRHLFICIPFVQLSFQVFQMLATFLSIDQLFINSIIVSTSDYESSVFVTNGLSMFRFSGFFNQPFEAGLFFALSSLNYLLFFFSDSSSRDKYVAKPFANIYIVGALACVIGLVLCGSKIVIPVLLVLFYFSSRYLLNVISSLRISAFVLKFFAISFASLISLFLIVFRYFSDFFLINPLFNLFSGSRLFSIYQLTAGRLSSSSEESVIVTDFNLFEPLGIGYHKETYDVGFLYILHHVGFVGLFLILLFLFSIPFSRRKSLVPIVFRCPPIGLLFLFYIVFVLVFALGGSLFTVPKASSFLLLNLIFLTHFPAYFVASKN